MDQRLVLNRVTESQLNAIKVWRRGSFLTSEGIRSWYNPAPFKAVIHKPWSVKL